MAGGGRRRRSGGVCLAIASVTGYLSLTVLPAFAASQTINSSGPLTKIAISETLNCSVNRVGDTEGAFFGDTACGTFLAAGGKIFGPSVIPAGTAVTNAGNYVPFTPISQPAFTGTGTAADPFRIVTVVDAGTTGIRLTEVDTYIIGQESYRTDVTLANGGAQTSAVLYRAGDCVVGDQDSGFGDLNLTTGAVSCVGQSGGIRTSRIEQWRPLTSGSTAVEDFSGNVWSDIATGSAFPNMCLQCPNIVDNGAGLSWATNIPGASSLTFSDLATFSPTGTMPLVVTKTADEPTVGPGAADGYTITVSNPTSMPAPLNSISDNLPPGFLYAPGTTAGVVGTDPAVNGSSLTWTGSISVPAGGSIALHFAVVVAAAPGTYFNNATADAGTLSVIPTGNTAPIAVVITGPVITTTTSSTTTTSTTVAGGSTTTSTTTSTTVAGGTTTTTSTTVAGETTTTTSTTVAGGSGDTTTTTAAGNTTTATDNTGSGSGGSASGGSGSGATATTAAAGSGTTGSGTLAFTGARARDLLRAATFLLLFGGVILLVEWRKGLWHIGRVPPVRRPTDL